MDAASRFRCNIGKQAHGYAQCSMIPTKIANPGGALGIPIVAKEFADLRSGLVLVTGPTGSGKSTTLASLIDYTNDKFLAAHRHDRRADRYVHDINGAIITSVRFRAIPNHFQSR